MNKTKIEWADYTWNPVTGCRNDCTYCYARAMANRFDGHMVNKLEVDEKGNIVLDKPVYKESGSGSQICPYPVGFIPTFYRYRLNEPQDRKTPSKIFVSSMGDLFGPWVPAQWQREILRATMKATHHTYMFLTKYPKRYISFQLALLPFHWIGTTITCKSEKKRIQDLMKVYASGKKFLSIEPLRSLLELTDKDLISGHIDWVIIGAETGNHKWKAKPKRDWIENIVEVCDRNNIPVLMKDNLKPFCGEDFRREYIGRKPR